jgi:hypothetical protein
MTAIQPKVRPSENSITMFILIFNSKHTTPIAVFDLKKKHFIHNPFVLGALGALVEDLAFHGCHGYKANLVNLDKLPRNRQGFILDKAIPKRLTLEELQAALTEALKPRPGVVRSEPLKGLRGGLTPENRYQRPKIITDQMLISAAELRGEGHTWRVVANALGVGMSAIKWACQKMRS